MADLLSLARSVSRRLPLSTTVSSVVGNEEPLIAQLLALMEEEGNELMQGHEWSRLITTWQFDVDADPHEEEFPTDFDRYMNNADVWRSGSNVVPLIGPVKSSDWHFITDVAGTSPGYWRPFGTGIQITGVPTDESVDVEYVSKNWIIDNDGETGKPEFESDDDTIIFDDDLLKAGVRWRWKQSKGLAYAEDMATYERLKEKRIAADRAARPIPTSKRYRNRYWPYQYSWPGQVDTS